MIIKHEKEREWLRIEPEDAAQFFYDQIPGIKIRGCSLNNDWVRETYKDILTFNSKDPFETLLFIYRGQIYIDISAGDTLEIIPFRDWITDLYEHDHTFFPDKIHGKRKFSAKCFKEKNKEETKCS